MKKKYFTPIAELYFVSAKENLLGASQTTTIIHDEAASEVSYSRSHNYDVWTEEETEEDDFKN